MLAILLALGCLLLFVGITHTLTLSWARNGESIAQTVQVTDDDVTEENGDFVIGPDLTDQERAIEFAVADVLALYIHSDAAISLQTNDGAAPDDTIALLADKPLVWYEGCGWDLATVFTVDVTSIFFTTGEIADDATVKVRILLAGS
jgi:hypothetical protein